MSVLRPGLLDGLAVVLDGQPLDGPLATELQRLGARVRSEPADTNALVFDAAPAFGAGGDAGLMAMLTAVWAAVGPFSSELISAERSGKVVLIAPAPGAGPLAVAAADALENLARTLSVEWARHGITTCAIAPGPRTEPAEVAELVAYLLSPAGDYFTGTRLALDAVDQPPCAGSSAQGTMTASS